MIGFFRGLSLRKRFLVAPLLGLVVCSLLTAAFVYESQRQNALLSRVTERDLRAFDRYAEVFVNLTEQHMALDGLLDNAGKMDEETLYDQAKQHLYKVQQAVYELEQALPPVNEGVGPEFAALQNQLSADAQAYWRAVNAAVGMATVNVALAPDQLAHSNERFTAVNRSFIRVLDLERENTSSEIAARVRQSRISSTSIAVVGVSAAALLLFLSLLLSRLLSRSIETQVGILTDLAAQAGARVVVEGSDEVGRMAQAIAAFRQSLSERRESERRFSDLLGNVELVSIMVDGQDRLTYCNDYFLRLTGWQREEVLGRRFIELFIPPDLVEEIVAVHSGMHANLPEASHHENEILTRSGERRLVRWNNSVLRSGAGAVTGIASIGEDITEQKQAEIRIKRLNRVYAVLSGINTLIVRVRERDELFREACRIAVEHGQFQMAWIAVVDPSAMKMALVASAGVDQERLAAIKERYSSGEVGPLGNSMAARAMREKKAVVANDLQKDPLVLLGKKHADAGIHSLAILPLMVADDALGVLALYAGEIGFFDEEEMKLLTELAGDIAFAMDHLEKEKKLNYLAYYDALTGLANRSLFLERMAQYMRSAVSGGHKLGLFLIDVERFKNINDSLGRAAGDALLKQVAEWLTRSMGDASLLARLGADHFAVVLPQVRQDGDVALLLEKSMAAFLEHPFRLNDTELRIATKVGVALFPDDGSDADTLLRNAEVALKKAKTSGERYLFYTQSMNERVAEKLSLENKLRRALDKEEFVLHYQPKVDLEHRRIVGVEALIRWQSPELGLVPPLKFIALLEETGLILQVGSWALRRASLDHRRWVEAGLRAPRVAVNVSAIQLRQRDFVAVVERAIFEGLAPTGIDLEITESLLMDDVQGNIEKLKSVRGLGVNTAIDDFGTGYSSLAYLAKLPVDTLKIDRSFIITMLKDPDTMTLVRTMISLAHSLRLKVVAEGVDAEEQAKMLRLLGCDQMQGYLFSKPVPAEVFETRFLAAPVAA